MKEMNGLHVFEAGDEAPALPTGLTDQSPVVSRFGFKIGQANGKPVWEAATEADFRKAEAQRQGIKPEDVQILDRCYNTSPTTCSSDADCPVYYSCQLIYYPPDYHYYCQCT